MAVHRRRLEVMNRGYLPCSRGASGCTGVNNSRCRRGQLWCTIYSFLSSYFASPLVATGLVLPPFPFPASSCRLPATDSGVGWHCPTGSQRDGTYKNKTPHATKEKPALSRKPPIPTKKKPHVFTTQNTRVYHPPKNLTEDLPNIMKKRKTSQTEPRSIPKKTRSLAKKIKHPKTPSEAFFFWIETFFFGKESVFFLYPPAGGMQVPEALDGGMQTGGWQCHKAQRWSHSFGVKTAWW